MEPIEIECVSCGESFAFTIDEQRIYTKKQFDDPKRCPECRKNKLKVKQLQNNRPGRKRTFDWSEAIN